ncbi:MAG: cupin domain-containing protein [Candidatus Micrarchaeota archaeon]
MNPTPENLSKTITYQRGGVVSRELARTQGGTVTLFAFDAGQALSEHTAPFDALIIALEGNAQATVSGKTFAIHDGEYVILPANKPHALKATTRFKMLLVMLKA